MSFIFSCYFNTTCTLPVFNSIKLSADELAPYCGQNTSKQNPLAITIKVHDGFLVAQAEGQEAFTLDAMGNHVFNFDLAGVTMEFDPLKKQFTLKQGRAEFLFEMENLQK